MKKTSTIKLIQQTFIKSFNDRTMCCAGETNAIGTLPIVRVQDGRLVGAGEGGTERVTP